MARSKMSRSHFAKPKKQRMGVKKQESNEPIQREKIPPPEKTHFTRRERKAMRLGETVKSLRSKFKKRGRTPDRHKVGLPWAK